MEVLTCRRLCYRRNFLLKDLYVLGNCRSKIIENTKKMGKREQRNQVFRAGGVGPNVATQHQKQIHHQQPTAHHAQQQHKNQQKQQQHHQQQQKLQQQQTQVAPSVQQSQVQQTQQVSQVSQAVSQANQVGQVNQAQVQQNEHAQ